MQMDLPDSPVLRPINIEKVGHLDIVKASLDNLKKEESS